MLQVKFTATFNLKADNTSPTGLANMIEAHLERIPLFKEPKIKTIAIAKETNGQRKTG